MLAIAEGAVAAAAGGRRPEAVRLPLYGALLHVAALAGGGAPPGMSPAAVAAMLDGARADTIQKKKLKKLKNGWSYNPVSVPVQLPFVSHLRQPLWDWVPPMGFRCHMHAELPCSSRYRQSLHSTA